MKNYIALKPCRFQGVNYKIGEKISEEIIGKKAVGGLISMEYISEDNSPTFTPPEPEKNLPQEISTTEEVKKPKKKSKVGDENDVQLQS